MTPIQGFKIWQINDSDWIWGTSFAEALQGYINQCGVDLDELFADVDGEIESSKCELSDHSMMATQFRGDDSEDTKVSFKIELTRRVLADEDVGMFASTEY